MLSAIESKFTCLLIAVRTPVLVALSKTSTSHTRHNFLNHKEKCNYLQGINKYNFITT